MLDTKLEKYNLKYIKI